MYLGNGVPVILRQTADAMGDMQLMLTHNGGTTVAQQLIVMQQRTSDSILNGQHANGCRVLLHVTEYLLEGVATDELYLFILEIEVSSNVVERPYQSLYRYSFHLII